MKSKLIAPCLLLLASSGVFAQCCGGQCQIQPQAQITYGDGWCYVGQYPNGYYMIRHGDRWVYQKNRLPDQAPNVKTEPKAEPAKVEQRVEPRVEQNFGVDKDRLSGEDAYTVHTPRGSCEVSKQEAHKIVGDTLKDDSNELRVTVIGDDGAQKKVLADINSLVKDINDWAIVRGYPPGHWALQPGFVQSGTPTIYCQAPGGKVLHRQDDYAGGGEELAEALRKAKSSYDARKDPDLRKSQVPFSDNSKLLTYGLAALGGAGITHLAKRRKP